MIYIKSFNNYDEFKNIFGMHEHGNGAKSRKNKILLACLKDRTFFHYCVEFGKDNKDYSNPLSYTTMDELKSFAKSRLKDQTGYRFFLDGWSLSSIDYKLDNLGGLCEDGDSRAIRYVNIERDRVFKMKAGKFLTHIIEEHEETRRFPEQLKRWLGEEFSREWQAYATEKLSSIVKEYTLHVDKDFEKIYNAYGDCEQGFGSCMSGGEHAKFYENSIDASAAYLTNAGGKIVARCIVYNDVTDVDTGDTYRLAERQYAKDGDNVLKQLLVNALIREGYIDGYKKVGVGCHDNRAYVSNDGDDWSGKRFSIDNTVGVNDAISYQDSFVYLSIDNETAYNYEPSQYEYMLDTTDMYLECTDKKWSEYDQEYIDEDVAVWDDYYGDWMHEGDATMYYTGTSGHYYDNSVHINRTEYNFCWSEYYDSYILDEDASYSDNDEDYYFSDEVVELHDGTTARECDCHEHHDGDWYLEGELVEAYHEQYGVLHVDWFLLDEVVDCEDETAYPILKEDATYSELLDAYYWDEELMREDEAIHRETHALMVVA